MASALVLRLDQYARLSQSDREALEQLNRLPLQKIPARTDLIREGDNPRHVRLIVEGWACRYKSTLEGSRQIVGFFIPGDFCDFNVYILRQMDHSIGTITRARVAQITPDRVEALTADRRSPPHCAGILVARTRQRLDTARVAFEPWATRCVPTDRSSVRGAVLPAPDCRSGRGRQLRLSAHPKRPCRGHGADAGSRQSYDPGASPRGAGRTRPKTVTYSKPRCLVHRCTRAPRPAR